MVRLRGRFWAAGVEVARDGSCPQTRRYAPDARAATRARARPLGPWTAPWRWREPSRAALRGAAAPAGARSAPARRARPGARGGGRVHGLRPVRRLERRPRRARPRGGAWLGARARTRARAGDARDRRQRAAAASGVACAAAAAHRRVVRVRRGHACACGRHARPQLGSGERCAPVELRAPAEPRWHRRRGAL